MCPAPVAASLAFAHTHHVQVELANLGRLLIEARRQLDGLLRFAHELLQLARLELGLGARPRPLGRALLTRAADLVAFTVKGLFLERGRRQLVVLEERAELGLLLLLLLLLALGRRELGRRGLKGRNGHDIRHRRRLPQTFGQENVPEASFGFE